MSYEIIKIIGEGASAVSYLAKDANSAMVLVKRFKNPVKYGEDNRWEREAELLKQLQHPQIPTYIDLYIEKIDGRRFPHMVQECPQPTRRPT